MGRSSWSAGLEDETGVDAELPCSLSASIVPVGRAHEELLVGMDRDAQQTKHEPPSTVRGLPAPGGVEPVLAAGLADTTAAITEAANALAMRQRGASSAVQRRSRPSMPNG